MSKKEAENLKSHDPKGRRCLSFLGLFPNDFLLSRAQHILWSSREMESKQWVISSHLLSPLSSLFTNPLLPKTGYFSSPQTLCLPTSSSNGDFLALHPTE